MVVAPQNSSTDLPSSSAACNKFRHGGASGFFGLPFANPFRYALHRPDLAGPVGSGPTPRVAAATGAGRAATVVSVVDVAPVVAAPLVVAAAVVVAPLVVVAAVVVAPVVVVVSSVVVACVVDVASVVVVSSASSCSSDSLDEIPSFDRPKGRLPVAAAATPTVDQRVTPTTMAAVLLENTGSMRILRDASSSLAARRTSTMVAIRSVGFELFDWAGWLLCPPNHGDDRSEKFAHVLAEILAGENLLDLLLWDEVLGHIIHIVFAGHGLTSSFEPSLAANLRNARC